MRRGVTKEAICTEINLYNQDKKFFSQADINVKVAGISVSEGKLSQGQEVICLQTRCPLAYRCTRVASVYNEYEEVKYGSILDRRQVIYITPTLSPTQPQTSE